MLSIIIFTEALHLIEHAKYGTSAQRQSLLSLIMDVILETTGTVLPIFFLPTAAIALTGLVPRISPGRVH